MFIVLFNEDKMIRNFVLGVVEVKESIKNINKPNVKGDMVTKGDIVTNILKATR